MFYLSIELKKIQWIIIEFMFFVSNPVKIFANSIIEKFETIIGQTLCAK